MTSSSHSQEVDALACHDEVAHLFGMELPDIPLTSTDGASLSLVELAGPQTWLIIYAHPSIGAPDRSPIAANWHEIPGAYGCTSESCSFRDLNSQITRCGAAICGLSTQSSIEQKEAAIRLHLPFTLFSDESLRLTSHMSMPTWNIANRTLLKRFTIVAKGRRIEHVFAPVTEPATHALEVASWIQRSA